MSTVLITKELEIRNKRNEWERKKEEKRIQGVLLEMNQSTLFDEKKVRVVQEKQSE